MNYTKIYVPTSIGPASYGPLQPSWKSFVEGCLHPAHAPEPIAPHWEEDHHSLVGTGGPKNELQGGTGAQMSVCGTHTRFSCSFVQCALHVDRKQRCM